MKVKWRINAIVRYIKKSVCRCLACLLLLAGFSLASAVYSDEYKWEEIQTVLPELPYVENLANQQTGYSTDVYENYLVVGAPGPQGDYSLPGKAYVYKKEAGTWHLKAIFQPDRYEAVNFGFDVAISENLIAISAVSDRNYRNSSVYLYEKNAGEWQSSEPSAVLTSSRYYYDYRSFGTRLSITDDTVVIGSPTYTLDSTLR